jgi:hypothetical protein
VLGSGTLPPLSTVAEKKAVSTASKVSILLLIGFRRRLPIECGPDKSTLDIDVWNAYP